MMSYTLDMILVTDYSLVTEYILSQLDWHKGLALSLEVMTHKIQQLTISKIHRSYLSSEDWEPLPTLIDPRYLEKRVALGQLLDVCQLAGGHLDGQNLPGTRHLFGNQRHLNISAMECRQLDAELETRSHHQDVS